MQIAIFILCNFGGVSIGSRLGLSFPQQKSCLFIVCLCLGSYVFVVDTHTHISPAPRRFVSGSNFDMEGFSKTRHHAFFWPVRLCQANRRIFGVYPASRFSGSSVAREWHQHPNFVFAHALYQMC